mgnify:CR=1 FL=1
MTYGIQKNQIYIKLHAFDKKVKQNLHFQNRIKKKN